jgi:hypothetical protein
LTAVSNNFSVDNNSTLTSLTIPVLNTVGALEISGNKLSTLSFPSLTTGITSNNTNFYVSNENLLTSLSFPVLSTVSGYVTIASHPNLTALSLPNLSVCGGLYISGIPLPNSISLPALTTVSPYDLNINSNSGLVKILLPILSTTANAYFSSNAVLTQISIPSLASVGVYFQAQSNALPSSEINNLLNKLLSVTPTTGVSIYLNGQTPAAPPTGAGITAKATLITNGQFVTTD